MYPGMVEGGTGPKQKQMLFSLGLPPALLVRVLIQSAYFSLSKKSAIFSMSVVVSSLESSHSTDSVVDLDEGSLVFAILTDVHGFFYEN